MIVKYADDKTENKRGKVEPNQKLFVGKTGTIKDKEELRVIFEEYGTVEDVTLVKSMGESKKYGFVMMSNRDEALAAIKALHEKHTCPGTSDPMVVRFAEQRRERNFNAMPPQPYGYAPYYGGPPAPYGAAQYPGQGYAGHQAQPYTAAPAAAVPYKGAPAAPYTAQPYATSSPTAYTAPSAAYGSAAYGHSNAAGGVGAAAYAAPAPYPAAGAPAAYGGGAGGAGGAYGQGGPKKNMRGPQGANLFVLGFPEYVNDDALYNLFAPYGTVLSANVMRDPATGASKNFGFVSYEHPQHAQAAMQALNGQDLGTGKRMTVELKKGAP